MSIQRYSVNPLPIQTLLSWINSEEIAIPEIQRHFVWSATKVRDLIDSLYAGYPIGHTVRKLKNELQYIINKNSKRKIKWD